MSRHAEAGPPPGGPSRLRPFGPASGDVGPDVPHDRVYHLETLAGHGLYRCLVGHAPVAAALVVLPVVARAARQARAAEYEQVLELLVALPRGRHRVERGPRLAVPGHEAAVAGQVVVVLEVGDVHGEHELRGGPGADAGHREQAPVRLVTADLGLHEGREVGDEGGVLGDPRGEHPDEGRLCLS